MGPTCLDVRDISWLVTCKTYQKGLKLGLIREGDGIMNTEVQPRVGAALSEGGKANGSISAALGSTVCSRAHPKCLCTDVGTQRE